MPVPQLFAASTVGICNMALQALAVKRQIASITENSTDAVACAAFYDTTRDDILREFNWPFARQYATLVLVGGTSTVPVTLDYQYSYRVPADCLLPRRIQSGNRMDTMETRIPFIVGADTTGGLIFTDFAVVAATAAAPQQPVLEYTAEVLDETKFASDFTQAFAFKLAFYIAPATSLGGDSGKLGARAYQLYQDTMARAEARALNGQALDPMPESSFITTRDGPQFPSTAWQR